jgi:tetratricopeptide (TPR) repeat protein
MEALRVLRHLVGWSVPICICCFIATGGGPALAQTTPFAPRASEEATRELKRTTEQAARELRSSVESAERRTANLENYLLPWVLLPLTVLVGLLAAGGAVGLFTSFKTAKGQVRLHDLAVKSEEAAHDRTEKNHLEVFRSSQETITLVNDTLKLARDASEQAATAMSHKARDGMMELDREIKYLLAGAYETHDFKAVVKQDVMREGLADIARGLVAVEGILQTQDVGLTPHCLFAKGIDLHLKALSKPAIDCLVQVPHDGDHELSALALFWAAYESNNIGNFDKAVECLQQASEHYLSDTYRAQHYELTRCEIQAHFFAMAWNQSAEGASRRGQIVDLLEKLSRVVTSVGANRRPDFVVEGRHCAETTADMLFWCAQQSPVDEAHGGPSDEQRTFLNEAAHHYQTGGDHIWAQFGLAQARWALEDELTDAEYSMLHSALVSEGAAHREARTLALRHAAILIVEGEHGVSDDALHQSWRDLWNDVSKITGDITIFSPWQRRNVPRADFLREAQTYYERKSGRATQASTQVVVRGYEPSGSIGGE